MATPTYATVISQIETYIVANANNEITANVLNPILKVITDFANNTIGELTDLTTTDTDTIVGAINSLKIAFENLQNNGIQLSTGYTNPNVTPPTSYNYGDFYMELDISDDSPIQLWQWNGTEWTTYTSVYTKAEIDYLLSNYYTKSELLTQIGISTGGQNELIEKGFNHVINFDWFVFAQVYRFNGIVTENLVTDTITLDPSPTTTNFKRFDVIVFNDNFTFSVVKGDEGLNPAIPKIDIKTQIQLTVILVEANTTEPSYLTKQLMYDEGVGLPTEFAVTKTGTTITINSTEQSFSGTKSIKVANPINSDVLFLDKNVVFSSLDVDTISFKVKNLTAGNWRFYLYSYNSIDSFYQGTVIIKNGTYGYKSNNITDWQTVIVPMSHMFGSSEVLNTGFALTFFNDSLGTFFFDEFALNGNFTQAPVNSGISEAPIDDDYYVRRNAGWFNISTWIGLWNAGLIAIGLKENISNKQNSLTVDGTGEKYPTVDAVNAGLATKLNTADYNQHFKGVYLTLAALNAANPTASVGDYAQVNEVGAADVLNYNWDAEENVWIPNAVGGSGATNTDELPEGTSNLYFTVARFLANLTYANVIAALGFTPSTAPNDAQKNSDILKAEIEAKLTGVIASHSHLDDYSWAMSDLTTALVSGDTSPVYATYDFTLNGFFVSVGTAPTGSSIVVNLKKNGVTVLSTQAQIQVSEFTSLTGVSPVVSVPAFVKGDKITAEIVQVGSTIAGADLKIYLDITRV